MSEHNAFQIQSCRIKERYSRWSCTQKRRSNQSTASPFRWSCNTLLRFGAYLNTSSGCHGVAGGGGGRRVGPRPAGWLAGRWPVKRWDDGGMCLELRGALFCARGERPCPSLICPTLADKSVCTQTLSCPRMMHTLAAQIVHAQPLPTPRCGHHQLASELPKLDLELWTPAS